MIPFHLKRFDPCYESHFNRRRLVAIFLVLLNVKPLIANL